MRQQKKHIFIVLLCLMSLMALCLSLVACGGNKMYSVTIADYDETQGTVAISPASEDGKYKEGTEITVTVTPNEGYALDTFKLSTDERASTPNNEGKFVFEVKEDTTISATFKVQKFSVTKNAPENGTIEITPASADGKYEKDAEITVTLAPATGYEVDTFTVGGVDKKADLQDNVYKFNIAANTEINATFKAKQYTVTASCEEAQGTITLSPEATDGKYAYGTKVTVTVEAKTGYELDEFTVSTDAQAALDGEGKYILTVSDNTTISATFNAQQFTVTTTVTGESEQGSIALSPEPTEGKYAYGTRVTVTVTAKSGYGITPNSFKVSTDPDAELVDGSYTFTVTADATISVAIHQHEYSEYEIDSIDRTFHVAYCDVCDERLRESHQRYYNVSSSTEEIETISCGKGCGYSWERSHKLHWVDDGNGNCYQECTNTGPICNYETETKPHDMKWLRLDPVSEGHSGVCNNCGYTVEKEAHDTLGEGDACSKCGYKDTGEHTCIEHLVADANGFYDGECQICHQNVLFEIDATGQITAFKDYTSLKTSAGELKIKIPAKVNGADVKSIKGGNKASVFSSNTDITDVVIAENQNLTSLSSYLFENCTSLKHVVILASISSVETMVFNGCSSLKYVVLPGTITTAAKRVFGLRGVAGLETVYWGGTKENWNTLSDGMNVGSAALKIDGEWSWSDDTHDIPKIN